MKFTDLFIRRPVIAIVVNLVIVIAGLQAIRSLNARQYPRSENAADHRHHHLRRRERRAGARLHHHAARARHRRRRRHRLHRVGEQAERLDHHAPGCASTTTRRGPSPRSARRSTRCAAISRPRRRSRSSTSSRPTAQFASAYLELLVRVPQAERDHRLPRARGPAAALRHRGRAARRHPRRPDLRDADLAQARPHGGPEREPGPGPRGARARTTTWPRSGRPRARSSR